MKTFVLLGIILFSLPVYAYKEYIENMDGYDYDPNQHYSIKNRIIPQE